MSKRAIFSFCTLFLVFFYLKLPHLLWLPGILYSYFMSQGYIFFKDFLNFHFPLSTFLILPFYLISDWNLKIEPGMSLIISIATLFVLYKTCARYLSLRGTAICLVFFTILYFYFTTAVQYNLESLVGLLLSLLLLFLFLVIKSKSSNPILFLLIGLLISLAELFGQIASLSLLSIFFLTIFYIWNRKKPEVYPLQKSILLLTGILLPAICISFYFLIQGAFGDLFENNITYYFIYLQLVNEKGSSARLPWNDILMFYTPLLLSSILILKSKALSQDIATKLNVLTLVSISTIPTVIFSVFHPHHFLYALPILSLLAGLVFDINLKSKVITVLIIASGIFLLYQVIFSVLPWYIQKISSNKGQIIVNDSIPGDNMYEAALWVKNNTTPTTKILVAGDGLFYFKSQRLPSTKYHVILPWHYKPLSKTIPIIQKSRPDYWIIGEGYLERISSKNGWNSPEITKFVQNELQSCYKKEITLPEWQIWKKSCSN